MLQFDDGRGQTPLSFLPHDFDHARDSRSAPPPVFYDEACAPALPARVTIQPGWDGEEDGGKI